MLIYVNITEKTDRRTNKNFKFIVRNLTKVKISNKYHWFKLWKNYAINFYNCVLIKPMYVILLMNSTRELYKNFRGPRTIRFIRTFLTFRAFRIFSLWEHAISNVIAGGRWNENFVYQPYLRILHQKLAPPPPKAALKKFAPYLKNESTVNSD